VLKTKVHADLAGHSLPLVPSKEHGRLRAETWSPSQNNNLLTAHSASHTETWPAMEDLWTQPSTTPLTLDSTLKLTIHTLPPTRLEMPATSLDHMLPSQFHTPVLLLQALQLWKLLSRSSPFLLLLKPINLPSNSTSLESSRRPNAVLLLITVSS